MCSPAKRLRIPAISLVIPAIVVFIACMVIYPKDVFEASKTGISAWWNIVFPALLPFFISSELLMSYGIVQFMGVLLEPVMRPLFNLPGSGAFVMAVGYTSGFPISASLTARLRKDNLCTRFEGERLMCFTNNASPLFILVAVGVGMFGNPRLGIIIALSHYASNLLLGLLLRFYKSNDPEFVPGFQNRNNTIKRAVLEMRKAFRSNPRPFGKILGDAITSSINKLLLIGGFVIVFSVIIRVADLIGIMSVIRNMIGLFTFLTGFSQSAVFALSQGFFEITLGTKAASEATGPLIHKAGAACIILGWSGLSVLAQVAAMISETDFKMKLFVCSRIFQGFISWLICSVLLSLKSVLTWLAEPVTVTPGAEQGYPWLLNILLSSRLCLYTLLGWVLLALTVYVVRNLTVIRL